MVREEFEVEEFKLFLGQALRNGKESALQSKRSCGKLETAATGFHIACFTVF